MGRTFVMGDIHGAYRALKQCLEISAFDYNADRLICLGDVADGWPDTKACIDELLRVKNLIYIFGNHDFWTLEWMTEGTITDVWYAQGGEATIKSYNKNVPQSHIAFFEAAKEYYVEHNKLFVHAGIVPGVALHDQSFETFLWDRKLAARALDLYNVKNAKPLTSFDEVYIGHTPIQCHHPIQCAEVWLMDTGAGWSGVLSMMDLETKEIFTSETVPSLYPGIKGRTKKAS
jgi:serine/threonine protein phosphatase 1